MGRNNEVHGGDVFLWGLCHSQGQTRKIRNRKNSTKTAYPTNSEQCTYYTCTF